MTPPSLRHNFSWTLAGNITYAMCQWGILVTLAKLGSSRDVGQFALGLAVGAPIMLFSQLNLRAVQATDASGAYPFQSYLRLRLLTTFGAVAVIALLAAAGGYDAPAAATVLLIGVMKGVDAVSDVYFGAWQRAEHMRGIAVAQIVNGVCSLSALAAAVLLTGSVVWGVVGALLGSVTSLLFVLRYDAGRRRAGMDIDRREPRPTDWRVVATLARVSLPLGFVMLLVSLNGNIPRYLIQHRLGESELGIFAAVTYLMMVGITVVNALGHSASPRLARYYATRDPRFGRLLWQLLAVGAGVGLAGIACAYVAGGWVLATLYTPAYAPAAGLLVWTMAASAIYYVASFLGYAITAARQLKTQVPLGIAVTAFIAVTSSAWIARWGVVGAMWSFGAAMILQALGSVVILWHAFRPRVHQCVVDLPGSPGRVFEAAR